MEQVMAIVQLKDVVVERLNRTGHGVKVAERYQVQGKDRKTTYTVWFKEPHGLNEGDIISVSGFLGAKVGDPWTGQDGQERRSVELSLNEPRINGGAMASEVSSVPRTAPQATTDEPWSTPDAQTGGWQPAGVGDDTPF
jgi:hypothetical protein